MGLDYRKAYGPATQAPIYKRNTTTVVAYRVISHKSFSRVRIGHTLADMNIYCKLSTGAIHMLISRIIACTTVLVLLLFSYSCWHPGLVGFPMYIGSSSSHVSRRLPACIISLVRCHDRLR
jgi:hypothetical protein